MIYVLSSISNFHIRLDKIPQGTDKIIHAVIYFILCLFIRRAFFYQNRFPLLKSYALMGAFIFSVVYGLLDEYHQRSVPNRSVDFYDFLADAGGALLYVAIFWLRNRQDDNGRELQKG